LKKLFFLILNMLLLIIACAISTVLGSNCGHCSLQWELAYHHDSKGCAKEGRKYSLLSAVLSGARVRVVIGKDYATEMDTAWVHNDNVFAQLLQHVSKASWYEFQDDAYWFWMIVSTDGLTQRTRYNVGSNVHRGSDNEFNSIKWYVKLGGIFPHAFYSHMANGESVEGDYNGIERSVHKGHEIRSVRNKQTMRPFHNILIHSEGVPFVVGQTVDTVSIQKSGDLITFQGDPYWLFSMVTTNGYRDVSRWSVGAHKSRGHTQDAMAVEWFADTCWKMVYFHDENGNAISGSLDSLTSAILSGHRVRLQFHSSHNRTVEPDNLTIRNSHVTAQLLKEVSKSGFTRFQDDAYWYWQTVSTTGTVRSTRYNIGEHKHRGDSVEHEKLRWFVDTRPWVKVFSNDADGNAVSGSKKALEDAAFNSGADVRCVQGDKNRGYAYKAQNLQLSPDGENIAAQSLNHVSIKNAPSPKEIMFQDNAYWWFTILTTTGFRDMSRWTVGEHQSRGHTSDKAGQTWFVSY